MPSTAWPCDNAVELTRDDYVRMVIRAEKLIEAGDYRRAERQIAARFGDAKLERRAKDLRALIRLRAPKPKDDLKTVVEHFKQRSESDDGKTDVRFRAWLAEAYLATGNEASAREILVDLHKRDLMPDGYAYLALAKLSTGEQRALALTACETRMKVKAMCTLPAKKVSLQTKS
ncbi:MAG TPA: hypothetical protein VFQ53_08885 [Kofleriaceae bacterium]|nr:hypothetical protein [Kofleriaceae bacterium]